MRHRGLRHRDLVIDVLIIAAAVLLFGYHCVYTPITTTGIDFSKHWLAPQVLLEGGSPYEGDLYMGFNYPLLTGGLFMYLAPLSRQSAEMVWDIGNVAFTLAGMCLLAFGLRVDRSEVETKGGKVQEFVSRHWYALVFLTIAAYYPLQYSLVAGNIDPFKLFLSALFTVLFARRREYSSGLVLAVLCLIKLVPILLILPLAVAGRWKTIAATVGVLCLYGFTLLLSGLWRTELILYTEILPEVPIYWREISGSLHRSAASILGPETFAEPGPYRTLIFSLNIVLLAAYSAWLVIWRRHPARDENALLAMGFVSLLAFTPLLEVTHFTWVLPAFFLLMMCWLKGELPEVWAAAVVGAGALIMAMDLFFSLHHWAKLQFPVYWIESAILLVLLVAVGGAGLASKKTARPQATGQ